MKQQTRIAEYVPGPRQDEIDRRLSAGLGWFSIGLGLAETLAPRQIARLIGAGWSGRTRTILRTYGLREIAAGAGILSQPEAARWLWSRVAGDLVDLSTMAAAMKSRPSDRGKLVSATAAVAVVTAVDVYCAQRLTRKSQALTEPVPIRRSIIIDRPAGELYRFWRDFSNAPKFMKAIESVQVTGDRHSHWRAKLPLGATVEWDSEIVEEQPGRFASWRSLPGSPLNVSGSIRFEPASGGRGTLVKVELQFCAPGASTITKLSKLFGADPGTRLQNDLRSFKQLMEVGEIVNSDASIFPGVHAAQPPVQTEEPVPAH